MFHFDSINSCTFIGNLGKNPVVESKGEGDNAYKIAKFSVAVKKRNRQDPKKPLTIWVNCACFQDGMIKMIEQYLQKGDRVQVNGELDVRPWQNEKKGTTEISWDLHLESVVKIGSAKKAEDAGSEEAPAAPAEPAEQAAAAPAADGGSGVPW